jgi:hypothetical protein
MGRTGRLAGWAEFHGRNSFGFKLNFGFVPWLWKIEQGDLGGICTWGFFLNSSRLLKDFRKIQYAMPCNAS